MAVLNLTNFEITQAFGYRGTAFISNFQCEVHDSQFRRIFRIEYLIRPEMAQYNFVPYGDTLMWCDSEKLGDACYLSEDYFNSYTAVYYPGIKNQKCIYSHAGGLSN